MQRDLLLLAEMIDAAERAHELVTGLSAEDLEADRLRSESPLWNFTVLGEAATQLSADHPHHRHRTATGLRTRHPPGTPHPHRRARRRRGP